MLPEASGERACLPGGYELVERIGSGGMGEVWRALDRRLDFKFGAQKVEIEVVASDDRQRFYLLVNRKSFLPVREGLDPSFPAPRLSELRSPAEDAGVRRDTREQRIVQAPQLFFDALQRTCDRVAPSTREIFCREWGVQWGRRAVVDMETFCLVETGRSLGELPMSHVATRISALVREQGWGALSLDLHRGADGALLAYIENSALASASRGGGRRCHLLAGMLGAVLTHLAGRRLHAEEVRCAAEGHPRCELVVVGQSRAERLRELLPTGRSPEALVDALRGTHV